MTPSTRKPTMYFFFNFKGFLWIFYENTENKKCDDVLFTNMIYFINSKEVYFVNPNFKVWKLF